MKHILKCSECGNYTLKDLCKCGGKAITTKPPKYSPDDRHAGYRRTAKQPALKAEGLL